LAGVRRTLHEILLIAVGTASYFLGVPSEAGDTETARIQNWITGGFCVFVLGL
jgi:hypothetical protein